MDIKRSKYDKDRLEVLYERNGLVIQRPKTHGNREKIYFRKFQLQRVHGVSSKR
jgi:hypothetical protein